MMIDWSHYDEKTIVLLLKPGNVYIWNTDQKVLIPVQGMRPGNLTCLRCNYKKGVFRIAAGHKDGSIWVWNSEAHAVSKISPKDSGLDNIGAVTDIQWDPLSNEYVICTHVNGDMNLVDVDLRSFRTSFARESRDIGMSAFVKSMPGCFLSINNRAPVLTLWNVSQSTPDERIRIPHQKSGINALKAMPDGRFFISFVDGTVIVYDLANRRVDFSTNPAHAETIFDCQFKHNDPNILATASYDGVIKIWDTRQMKNILTLKDQVESPVYAISWCPGGDDEWRLIASTAKGQSILWDAKRGVLLQRISHHTAPSLRITWNPYDPNLICSTSSDSTVVVFNPQGKVLKKYKHSKAIYGCDFNKINKNLLAVGGFDASVLVYDVSSVSNKPIHEFKGHTSRVFNVVWSPLLTNMIASGSDDRTIRVWDMSEPSKVKVLRGHTHNVRALVWSHEVPYILMSGSWDGTIRIWDLRTSECIRVVSDHHADVYGLISHPHRPFTFVSSSRDTSLRFWNMDEDLGFVIKIRSVLDMGQLRSSSLGELKDCMDSSSDLALCSNYIKNLRSDIHQYKDDERALATAYQKCFNYFNNTPGVNELWDLIKSVQDNQSTPPANKFHHINDVRHLAYAKASALTNKSEYVNPRAKLSQSDRLESAAVLHLKLGQIKECCELLIKLGKWERAIALAPARSLGYWKQLSERYTTFLVDKADTANSVPFLITQGNTSAAIHHQQRANDLNGAILTAASDAEGKLPMMSGIDDIEEEEDDVVIAAAKRKALASGDAGHAESKDASLRSDIMLTDQISGISDELAKQLSDAAEPIKAACAHLTINNGMRAVEKLMLGNEVMLAVAVANTMQLSFVDYVYVAAARISENLGLWGEALDFLRYMRDGGQSEITLLAARFIGTRAKKADFYQKAAVRSQEAFLNDAQEAETKGNRIEALKCYLAGGDHMKAAELGTSYLKELLSKGSWCMGQCDEIMRYLNSVNLEKISDAALKDEILAYSFYLGAQHAIFKGFTPVVSFMFEVVNTILSHGRADFPIHAHLMKMQEISYMQYADPTLALTLVNDFLESGSLQAKFKSGATNIKKALESVIADMHNTDNGSDAKKPEQWKSANIITPTGSNLPSGNNRHDPVSSIASKENIKGPRVALGDSTYLSLSEALMLSRCSPFSPALSGARLNVK